jgi:Flp pilus assembly pilin Flp
LKKLDDLTRWAFIRLSNREGQTLVEYSLILVVISMGTLGAMVFLRDRLNIFFSQVGNLL